MLHHLRGAAAALAPSALPSTPPPSSCWDIAAIDTLAALGEAPPGPTMWWR